jgi:hypothetical protein
MNRFGLLCALASLLTGLCGVRATAQARPALDQLLPDTTREWIAVTDLPQVVSDLERTPLGQALKDSKRGPNTLVPLADLGLTWEEVTAVTGGEAVWATVEMGPRLAGRVLLLDVTKRQDALKEKLQHRLARWKQQGGSERSQKLGEVTITVQERQADAKGPAQWRAHVVKDNLLLIADHPALLQGTLDRWVRRGVANLASLPAYRALLERTRPQGTEVPQVRFWYDPFGRAELEAVPAGSSKSDHLRQLKQQGFTAIKAVGGFLSFRCERYAYFQRIAVLAPPPYDRGMGLLRFLPGDNFAPESWVAGPSPQQGKKSARGEAAIHSVFYLDLNKAFESLGPAFDKGIGEQGAFQKVVEALKNDRDGPQLDLRQELVNQLTGRVTLFTDSVEEGDKTSVRQLLAFQVKDPQVVEQAVFKFVDGDDRVRERKVQKQTLWVHTPRGTSRVPSLAIAVARGNLFVSTQVDLMVKVLTGDSQQQQLRDQEDYQQVQKEVARLGGARGVIGQAFVRPGTDWRMVRSLLGQARLPGLDLLPALDGGANLPSGGGFSRLHPEGWDVVGFYLRPARAKP